MKQARIAIAIVGMFLPYVVRIFGGIAWFNQFADGGLFALLFFGAFNAIAWGSLIAISYWYRRPVSLLLPCAFGFSFLAWAYYSLDLAADAQAAIALAFIPIYALLPIFVGAVLGYVLDLRLR